MIQLISSAYQRSPQTPRRPFEPTGSSGSYSDWAINGASHSASVSTRMRMSGLVYLFMVIVGDSLCFLMAISVRKDSVFLYIPFYFINFLLDLMPNSLQNGASSSYFFASRSSVASYDDRVDNKKIKCLTSFNKERAFSVASFTTFAPSR